MDKSSEIFKEDFSDFSNSLNNIELNPLAKTQNITNINQLRNSVLGPQEELNETILGNILRKNSINKRKNVFLSEKDLRIPEFYNSLEKSGIISLKSEDFLLLRKMPKKTEQEFNDLKKDIIDENTLQQLYNYLDQINCNLKSEVCYSSIGGITPLTYLIESFFNADKEKVKEMVDKYNLLSPYIYNYRTISGDGNCFYRAVMFRYLEILIINNKIEYLQNVIFDIVNSFKSEELKSRRVIKNMDIKPELTIKILIMIVELLKKGMKKEAHLFLVKSFLTCQKFDYAIILYFRYILYDYIKNNENKTYTKAFPIKIGNLLPAQYETEEGKFLFNDFYENFLLKFYCEAEKIIIYLTPFVLGIELNIIIFDDNEDEIVKKFKWQEDSILNELIINDVISLINKKYHYEIIYSPKDYENNKLLFKLYENNKKYIFI